MADNTVTPTRESKGSIATASPICHDVMCVREDVMDVSKEETRACVGLGCDDALDGVGVSHQTMIDSDVSCDVDVGAADAGIVIGTGTTAGTRAAATSPSSCFTRGGGATFVTAAAGDGTRGTGATYSNAGVVSFSSSSSSVPESDSSAGIILRGVCVGEGSEEGRIPAVYLRACFSLVMEVGMVPVFLRELR